MPNISSAIFGSIPSDAPEVPVPVGALTSTWISKCSIPTSRFESLCSSSDILETRSNCGSRFPQPGCLLFDVSLIVLQ